MAGPSSGAPWTLEEEETLRQLYAEVVAKMEGRSEAAVLARLNALAYLYYRKDWPNKPLTPRHWKLVRYME